MILPPELADGVESLKHHLAAAMPPGPWLFPEDQAIRRGLERLARCRGDARKVFLQLHDELPYAVVGRDLNSGRSGRDGSVRIDQVLYVRRPGQRAIVLGDNRPAHQIDR